MQMSASGTTHYTPTLDHQGIWDIKGDAANLMESEELFYPENLNYCVCQIGKKEGNH